MMHNDFIIHASHVLETVKIDMREYDEPLSIYEITFKVLILTYLN